MFVFVLLFVCLDVFVFFVLCVYAVNVVHVLAFVYSCFGGLCVIWFVLLFVCVWMCLCCLLGFVYVVYVVHVLVLCV